MCKKQTIDHLVFFLETTLSLSTLNATCVGSRLYSNLGSLIGTNPVTFLFNDVTHASNAIKGMLLHKR